MFSNNNRNSTTTKKVINYNLRIFVRGRAITCAVGFSPVSKIFGKFGRDSTNEDIEKRQSNTVLRKNEDCNSQVFEYLKNYKSEPKQINVKCEAIFIEYETKLIGHNASGFDSCMFLNISPTWCRIF